MIVVDAPVLSYALALEPTHGPIRERIRVAAEVHAPDLVDLEVTSTVRGLSLGGKISADRAQVEG